MPSTATITSTDLTDFQAGTVIRSAKVDANFSIWRGHNLPVDPNTSTAATTRTYDLGASDHAWRYAYCSPVLNVVSTTGAYTLLSTDHVFIGTPASTITVSLPAVASVPTGKVYVIKNASASEIVLDGNGSELIDNTTTVSLNMSYQCMSIVSNGTAWFSM